jgi:hypothetical protein
LLAFRDVEEAARGAEEIARNYDRHAGAARAIAEKYFDSTAILQRLCGEIGVNPS